MNQVKRRHNSDPIDFLVCLFQQKSSPIILLAVVLELDVNSGVHNLVVANDLFLLSKILQVNERTFTHFLCHEVGLIIDLELLYVFPDPRNHTYTIHLPFLNVTSSLAFLSVKNIEEV